MYRAVALYALEHGMIDDNGQPLADALIAALPHIEIDFVPQADGSQHTMLNGQDVEAEIRRLRVSNVVSPVSAIAQVRKALVSMQKAMGNNRGIVMDGRDIGTVVFPDAELKIFVCSSPETRAQRRLKEMIEKGAAVTYEDVLANIVNRDHIDSTRAESPLRRADDAVDLDNSNMTIAQQDEWLMQQFENALNK